MAIPRLVVIDDEPDMGIFVCDVAEMHGFETASFTSVREFFRYQGAFDVVVLDLMMPEIDGIELLRMFSNHQIKAPLILISGVDETILHSARELTEELGLNLLDALQKPFLPQQLVELLDRVGPAEHSPDNGDEQPVFQADDLQHALESGAVIPFYQPQIALADNRLIGVEALARWDHPDHGIIAPYHFIPLAERSGLIEQLTWTMLEQIATDWQRLGYRHTVSVNMPANLYNDLDLPTRLTALLDRHRLYSDQITLEVTETALLGKLYRSLDTLTRLRMMGYHLSIDDYGTGYSSLVQLYRAPFSEMKIDRSFVMKMNRNAEALAIVEATLLLGHKLNMRVVAEGVEDQETAYRLAELGCDIAQGYHFARPMPVDQLHDWINRER